MMPIPTCANPFTTSRVLCIIPHGRRFADAIVSAIVKIPGKTGSLTPDSEPFTKSVVLITYFFVKFDTVTITAKSDVLNCYL